MEHTNRGEYEAIHAIVPVRPPTLDECAIMLGVAAAETENREIDDGTARRIAAQLHDGQDSALYALASSGHIDEERVYREIGGEFESQRDPELREWLNWLGAYCIRREHKGPVAGWHETTDDQPSTEHGLGQLALWEAAEEPTNDHDEDPEHDRNAGPPRILVGSLTDIYNGCPLAQWIDANQTPDELRAAIQAMLRESPRPDAEEWAILDSGGFDYMTVNGFRSLETVSKLARGITEYGPAFIAWADYVGLRHLDAMDLFEDHFRGEHDSMDAYVEDVLDGIGFHHELERALKVISEDLRRYVKVDMAAMARDWATELFIANAPDGRVWVFDP